MPPKQADKQTGPPPKEQTLLEKYGFPATLLVLSAAVSPISQLTLAPVYGAIPSAVNHVIALIFAVAVGYGSWIADGCPRKSQHIWITVFPFWAPAIQTVLLPFSKNLGPITGAILNGGISCHAVLLGSIYALAESLAVFDLNRYAGPRVGDTIKAALLIPAFLGMEKKMSDWISFLLTQRQELTPVHLQLALASVYSLYFPSWWVLLGIPGALHTVFLNPHFSMTAADTALNAHNWTLVDRQWSNTGYISVLDSFNESYRVLRADHSLLGGEWLLTEERRAQGWKANEPIYSAFEMLEAVRLMQDKASAVPDNKAQALVVGLGTGSAPKALINHGINTTIVELDPAVHSFATKYFDFPTNHTAVLQDATTWASKAATKSPQTYDYIIHDVFTGGAEPLSLFTAQFLTNLRTLLKPHGSIAINYAGDLVNPLTRSVLHTTNHVFSGRTQCKIFRDGPPERHALTEGSHEDFTNMIIFCKNGDPNAASQSLDKFFRTPTKADYLGRHSAVHYLLPKAEYEIQFPDPEGGDLGDDEEALAAWKARHEKKKFTMISLLEPLRALKDDPDFWNKEAPETHIHDPYTAADLAIVQAGDEKKYKKQQEESAIRHWYIMRGVLPDAVWELW